MVKTETLHMEKKWRVKIIMCDIKFASVVPIWQEEEHF